MDGGRHRGFYSRGQFGFLFAGLRAARGEHEQQKMKTRKNENNGEQKGPLYGCCAAAGLTELTIFSWSLLFFCIRRKDAKTT